MYIVYISYILLCTPVLRKSEPARRSSALGLPSWTARLACWTFLGLSTACLGLSSAIPGLQDCLKDSLRAAKTAASCNVLLKYVQNSCQFPQNSWFTVLLSPDGDICNTSIIIYCILYLKPQSGDRRPFLIKNRWIER